MMIVSFVYIALVASAVFHSSVPNVGSCLPDYSNAHCRPADFPIGNNYVYRSNPFDYTCCVGDCCHTVGGTQVQLNTRAFFRECYCHPAGRDENSDYIFRGVLQGFKIIDDHCTITPYVRSNYSSITAGEFSRSMQAMVEKVLIDQKITVTPIVPYCVHSIGGIPKKDGSLRQITDCKRPLGSSINNFMSSCLPLLGIFTTKP